MTVERAYRVARTDELASNGSRVIVEVDGLEIAVFRHRGEYYALPNFCPHQAGPLCEGKLVGETGVGADGWEWKYTSEKKLVSCPWHAWKFDITTGEHVDDPRHSLPTYDVEERDDGVYVTLGTK